MTFQDFIQVGVLLPLAYVWNSVVMLRREFTKHKDESYSKKDVDKLVDLKQEVVMAKLDAVHSETTRIREALEKINDRSK